MITLNTSFPIYNLKNSQRSIELFDEALNKGEYPSRLEHLPIAITNTFWAPLSLVGRISFIPYHIICLLIKSITIQEIPKFLIWDILYINSGIAISIIKITSAVCGIFFPNLTVKGWKLAAQIEAINWSYRWLENGFPNHNFIKVSPESAIEYFGKKDSLTIFQGIQGQKAIDKAYQDGCQTISDCVQQISKDFYVSKYIFQNPVFIKSGIKQNTDFSKFCWDKVPVEDCLLSIRSLVNSYFDSYKISNKKLQNDIEDASKKAALAYANMHFGYC